MTTEVKECYLCQRSLTDEEYEEAQCPESSGCGKHICDEHTGDTFMRFNHEPEAHIGEDDEFQEENAHD